MKLTVENGEIRVPVSSLGFEDGQEVFLVETESGLVLMRNAGVAKWALDVVSDTVKGGVDDVIARAREVLARKPDKILNDTP